jgi:DNA topoisomerase-1
MCSVHRARRAKSASETADLPDPKDSARAAGLRYVYDTQPGITRKRHRTGFRYIDAHGVPLRDEPTLARIKSLAIPPAWTGVWICASPNGHLQTTGRDARGRKQSRYHPQWRHVRDEAKYEHMLHFGESLPSIRKRITHDLALPNLPREKVLATIVRLLETTFIRIGNEQYARTNHSYGLTTMRRRHVNIEGTHLIFNFKGKSAVEHTIDVRDPRLARIVKACRDTPGYELFAYLDDDANPHTVGATDVNDYLHQITGQHFTAKDFRTWAGSVLASVVLRECACCDSDAQLKKNVVAAVKSVASRLGNTPAVCRKCYIHPAVLDAYMSGGMADAMQHLTNPHSTQSAALRPEEVSLLNLLQKQLAVAAD